MGSANVCKKTCYIFADQMKLPLPAIMRIRCCLPNQINVIDCALACIPEVMAFSVNKLDKLRKCCQIRIKHSKLILTLPGTPFTHDDVIKWKHFPRYWPFVRGIHRSPVNSPHKGQWRGALMLSLICTRTNGWINNGEAGDLRWYRAHYDVTVTSMVYDLVKFRTQEIGSLH